jgi:hypothetical protein
MFYLMGEEEKKHRYRSPCRRSVIEVGDKDMMGRERQ